MLNSILVLSSLAFAAGSVYLSDTPVVRTSSGMLQGKIARNGYGAVREYLSVPYAEKPQRFSLPKPIYTPDVARDATQLGPACVQPAHLKETISPLLNTNHTMTSEDCLNLNIYVPLMPESKQEKLPVIVWFPGEGFDYAMAQQFDGGYLATLGNSIVVNINYRVFAFGFLSTLTPEAPGNVGFWDQRLALKWIHENIELFGGDPEKVALMGRFTGSMSITAQMTSPVNRNGNRYFSRTILQSGIATGNWVFETSPRSVALKLAKSVGCEGSKLSRMIDCLRKIPADILTEKAQGLSWRPVLDGSFLTEDPIDSFKAGRVSDVDVMLGVNSDEGSLCLLSLYYTNSTYYKKVVQNTLSEDDFDKILNQAVEDFTKMKSPLQKLASHEYSKKENDTLRDSYVQFCGSMYITSQMEQAARYLAKRSTNKVFMYEFDHRPSFSIHPEFIRAAHGDDMLFSLGLVHKSDSVTSEELELSKKIIQSFSSFARNGQPTFKSSTKNEKIVWPQYKDTTRQILHFSTSVMVKPSTRDREVRFWHSVVPSVASIIIDNDQRLQSFEVVAMTNRTAGYIVGTLISVQTTEYVLLTLICMTMILIVAVAVAPYLLNRRTKKDCMLMEY